MKPWEQPTSLALAYHTKVCSYDSHTHKETIQYFDTSRWKRQVNESMHVFQSSLGIWLHWSNLHICQWKHQYSFRLSDFLSLTICLRVSHPHQMFTCLWQFNDHFICIVFCSTCTKVYFKSIHFMLATYWFIFPDSFISVY